MPTQLENRRGPIFEESGGRSLRAEITSWAVGLVTMFGLLGSVLPASAASPPAVRGDGGVVVSPERASTEAGLALLRAGGNAIDAAVATALAMAVVHPEAGNLGGGGFAVVRFDGEVVTLDFRETAPAAAHRTIYLDEAGAPISDASRVGPLAAGVPGSGPGLWELHQRYGARPWSEVVEPARRLAADGFPVTRRLARELLEERALLSKFEETARVWLPGGEPPPVGSTMRLPDLAATLAAYQESGREALTSGPVAAAVEAASRRHGGILTAADLAAYEPVWRPPVRFRAFGWEIASMGLPSSGGIILGQTLGLAERLDWRGSPPYGADRAHLLAEIWRRSFVDRNLLADPASTLATAAQLLDPAWLDRRAAEVGRERATPSSEIEGWPGQLEAAATNHLAAIDERGNVVSITTTLNGGFGCGLLVPGAGFLLNNEMDDFTTAPGHPNLYGLIQGEANAVAAGRRMLSSMTPMLAWRGDELLAAGGRGGSKIPTAVAQVVLGLLADGDDLQAAVNRPRVHHQWLPDRIAWEPDALSPETRAELARRGHALYELPFDERAKAHAVRRLPDGRFEAAGDPRGPAVGGVVRPQP